MKAHEIVKRAFDELDSVQFVDNTVKEAEQAKADVRYIIYQLAVCLTQRALDEATCTAKYHLALAEKGDTRCGVCGQPLRQ